MILAMARTSRPWTDGKPEMNLGGQALEEPHPLKSIVADLQLSKGTRHLARHNPELNRGMGFGVSGIVRSKNGCCLWIL